MARRANSDIGNTMDLAVSIITKDLRRILKLQDESGKIGVEDRSSVTDYLRTLNSVHREHQKADKDVRTDFAKQTSKELSETISALEAEEE
jgi:hypothetical protein